MSSEINKYILLTLLINTTLIKSYLSNNCVLSSFPFEMMDRFKYNTVSHLSYLTDYLGSSAHILNLKNCFYVCTHSPNFIFKNSLRS